MKKIKNNMNLFHSALDNKKIVKKVRASTLASYRWCSIKAWLQASGLEIPRNDNLSEGSIIHNNIAKARMMSPQEKKFNDIIKSYKAEGVISRPWLDGETSIVADGEITTHGYDDIKVDNKNRVTLIEYKTKAGWGIQATDFMPAQFQTQLYCWIMEPFLLMHGYRWKGAWLVYLKRGKDADGNVIYHPIGESAITDYNALKVEADIRKIFKEWDDASRAKTDEERRRILVPPRRWKCGICLRYSPEIYAKCPYQQGVRESV